VAAAQGLPAVRVRLLRPLEEPFSRVVRDVDLRQPDEEPRLSAATGSIARGLDLAELIGGIARALVVCRRHSHSIVPGGLLVTS
jgi:hypothetical protein